MTLYRHFGSKDELIIACLRDFASDIEGLWQSLEMSHPGDPMAQIYAWIRMAAECTIGDLRGCDMANVAVELAEDDHPARHVIEEFKTAQRNRLADLCRSAGIEKADQLADTLCLLIEGARVSIQSVGPEGPGGRYVSIANAVVAAFAHEARSHRDQRETVAANQAHESARSAQRVREPEDAPA